MIKKVFRVVRIVLLLFGIFGLFVYTQIWNPGVKQVILNKSAAFPLSTEKKLEDFNHLYQTLKNCFPYFEVKKRQQDYDWLAQKEAFLEKIRATNSDREYYEALSEILMLLQNGHTHMIRPGEEYDELSRLYNGLTPWSQVYNNSDVKECYQYWKTVLDANSSFRLPVSFSYIEGEYYASGNLINPEQSTDMAGVPQGSKLISVNDQEIDAYIKGLTSQRILKFDKKRQIFKLNRLIIEADKETELVVQTPEGVEKHILLKPYQPIQKQQSDNNMPEHLYISEKLDKDKIAYLKLPSFSSFYVEKDGPGIRRFLEETKEYKSLIIDIRGNGGGSTNYWMKNIVPLLTDKKLLTKNYLLFRNTDYIKPFIKHKMFFGYYGLKNIESMALSNPSSYYFHDGVGLGQQMEYALGPNSPVGFKGRILLLVDDYVYSSAEAFAAYAKATQWATLIGTHTGGDGIGYDPIPVALPNSGLIIRFPGEMGLNADGTINEETSTSPDIYAEQGYEDFMLQLKTGNNKKDDFYKRIQYDTVLRQAYEYVNNKK